MLRVIPQILSDKNVTYKNIKQTMQGVSRLIDPDVSINTTPLKSIWIGEIKDEE